MNFHLSLEFLQPKFVIFFLPHLGWKGGVCFPRTHPMLPHIRAHVKPCHTRLNTHCRKPPVIKKCRVWACNIASCIIPQSGWRHPVQQGLKRGVSPTKFLHAVGPWVPQKGPSTTREIELSVERPWWPPSSLEVRLCNRSFFLVFLETQDRQSRFLLTTPRWGWWGGVTPTWGYQKRF